MQNFIGGLFRFIFKLTLAAVGLVFAVSLLLLALIVLVLSLVKAVITGKKPAPVAVFGKFQKFSPGGMWPGRAQAERKADVVDIEVREVKESASDKHLTRDIP